MDHSSRPISAAGALFVDEAGRIRVLFVFEGGVLTAQDEIRLQAEELKSYEFVPPEEAGQRLIPRLARRVTETLRASESGETRYLEHGVSLPGSKREGPR